MGGNLGCHRSIPRDPSDLIACHGGGGGGGMRRRKFSAACNFSAPVLVHQERLNINAATEEELMTLPGVSRGVARSVVEHRDRIGGFRKVEDLALVSGVGATKLEAIRLEICVSSRTGSSQHSPSSSLLRNNLEHAADPHHQDHQNPCFFSGTGMNINTATPAQLQSIRGITEKIARNIVAYRLARGPFRSIEDLVKVDSINSSLLDKIRFHVFVERSRTPSTNTNNGQHHNHRSSSTQPSPTSFSLRSEELDLPPGGPTQMVSSRPDVEPSPRPGARDGRPTVRLATWNLQRCSCDKANNPGVKEVVCMTLLENHIKLLAVQDLIDREALDKFCVELNQATLASVRKWKTPRGLWKSVVSEKPSAHSSKGSSYSGFLWDSSCGIDLKDTAVLEGAVANGNGNNAYPRPYLARFLIGSSELTLVNVHMPAPAPVPPGEGAAVANGKSHSSSSSSDQSASHQRLLSPCIQETLKGEKELLVLGDFGGLPPHSPELDVLKKDKLCALVPHTLHTNISTRCPQGTACLDNIWVSRSLKKTYTGHCTVVREGLTNPWIPDNWSWGGVASDHCPVMAEFFVADAAGPPTTAVAPPKELSRNGVAVLDRGDIMPKHER